MTFQSIILSALLLSAVGCANLNSLASGSGVSPYTTESSIVSYDEIIVALPMNVEGQSVRNLHILLSVEMRQTKVKGLYPDTEASFIVEQASSRISNEIVDLVTQKKVNCDFYLSGLKQEIQERAQSAFEEYYGEWSKKENLKVKFLVTSLFLTDGSVGKTSNGSRAFFVN